MLEREPCVDVGLGLGLGLGCGGGGGSILSNKESDDRPKKVHPVQFHVLFPSTHVKEEEGQEEPWRCGSGTTTLRLRASDEDEEMVDREAKVDGGGGARKKLRLTKEQSALLEDSFRQHSTLNPMQKQELAQRLNLRPRQVEVWFQNRRARTKLKQTEVDYEFLKRCCESLSDENRRLKEELQELRSFKPSSALYMHMPKAAPPARTTVCPSCERAVPAGGSVPMVARPRLYNCSPHAAIKDSSMACCK